jgi:hypothetical protein
MHEVEAIPFPCLQYEVAGEPSLERRVALS